MFRKVVQQGPSTMMVSLPMIWVKQNKIKKGESLQVDIINNQLVINSAQQKKKHCEVIRIKSGEDYLDRRLMAKYREGCDELVIQYEDRATIKDIRETLKYLLGVEIIDQTAHSCTIKNLSSGSAEEYPATFRRLFQIVVVMANSYLEFTTKERRDILQSIIDLRETLIKLEQYSLRLVNNEHSFSVKKKSLEHFYIWHIGKLGRMWASVAKKTLDRKIHHSKQEIAFIQAIVEYTRDLHAAFENPDIPNILRMKKKLYALRPVGETLLEKSDNTLAMFYFLRMLNEIYEISLTFEV